MNPILIVDDEVEMRIAMSETLKHCGYAVETSHNAIDAIGKLKKNPYAMVITDMTMPKRSGIELLKDIREIDPAKPVLMVTAYGTIETAVEAMKLGAFDYILKPFKFDVFTFVVERALAMSEEPKTPRATGVQIPPSVAKGSGGPATADRVAREIVTANPAMKELLNMAENVANSKSTILVQSESGTGKELLARHIHAHSNRSDGPFVAVNCAALPDTLLETELFGHRKGSFTGAVTDHKGRFEQANGGTILLDEISEMALPLQAKLLRVLQEHEVDPVGSKEPIQVDVRVVATTNRDLFGHVEAGRFREDLYYRLNVIPMHLPPLRERKDDIPLLAEFFVKKHAEANGRKAPGVAEDTLEVLSQYNWRGNVRELENVMERAVLLCPSGKILPQHLMMGPGGKGIGQPPKGVSPGGGIQAGMTLREAEKMLILETLRKTGGQRTQAAKMLEISIRTLRNKLNEYAKDGDFEFSGDDGEEEED
ncbi:MAG: sigma-54 dependent transcriptional regulator [Deltaproteobacteria bacterium]|nr:sigma-54 dependent transcriptional regulator [Deltaproteobacteria bacterium]MDH4121995.1 sigma-54 dependent transcriptional regulator [Deltaproteobacteria bacterium]